MNIYGTIYKIENLVNGKVYIGQTTVGFDRRYGNISKRMSPIEKVYHYHINKNYCNKHLLSSIEKYGFENFKVYKIIDVAFSKQELDIKEQVYINLYNSIKNGYNIKEGGNSGKRELRFHKKLSNAKNNDSFILYEDEIYFSIHYLRKKVKNIEYKNIKHAYITKIIVDMDNFKIYYDFEKTSSLFNMNLKDFKNMCNRNKNKKYNLKSLYKFTNDDYLYIYNKEYDLL